MTCIGKHTTGFKIEINNLAIALVPFPFGNLCCRETEKKNNGTRASGNMYVANQQNAGGEVKCKTSQTQCLDAYDIKLSSIDYRQHLIIISSAVKTNPIDRQQTILSSSEVIQRHQCAFSAMVFATLFNVLVIVGSDSICMYNV